MRPVLFERAAELGGLVGSFDFDGHRVDRFYHVILPGDDRVRGLADEVGLGDRFRFRPTRVGFYDDGRLFSMSSLREFLTLPAACAARPRASRRVRRPLPARRAATSASTRRRSCRGCGALCGRRMVERLWLPLLDSKFDGHFDDLPATYIWARTRRMSATRDSTGREIMGWLEGGYETLIDALAARIRALRRRAPHRPPGRPDRGVGRRRPGVVVDGQLRPFDAVLCTLAPPQRATLLVPRCSPSVADGPLPLPRRHLRAPADASAASARTTRSTSPTGACR